MAKKTVKERRLVEGAEDVAGLDERFFVVEDMHGIVTMPDRYLVCRRDNVYGAATVIAHFAAFDYAHFCAKRLSEYDKKHEPTDELDGDGEGAVTP